MGYHPRPGGRQARWLMPTALIILAVIFLLGNQMRDMAFGTNPPPASLESQLQTSYEAGDDQTLAAAQLQPENTLAVTNSAAQATETLTSDEPTGTAAATDESEDDNEAQDTEPATTAPEENDDDSPNEEQPEQEEQEEEEEEEEEVKSAAERLSEYEDRWKAIAEQNSTLFGNSTSRDINIMHMAGIIKSGPVKAELHSSANQGRFPIDMPFLDALATCDTFECVRDAHMQPRYGARFNYPHFMILGWQKSATSSLYAHLTKHRQASSPPTKEPEFFTFECQFRVANCPPDAVKFYLKETLNSKEFLEKGGNVATFEASTHYVRSWDHLAPGLYNIFPWVKLIMMMREPISRAMSMLIHNQDVSKAGCLMDRSMAHCLMTESQLHGDELPMAWNYSGPLLGWLENFPAGQVMVLQYEDIVADTHAGVMSLRNIKKFLGMNPFIPKDNVLPVRNMRKDRVGTKGWPMTKKEYQKLIDMVRPDAELVARIISANGWGESGRWMANWESVWQKNLDNCDEKGHCTIFVS